MERVSVPRSVLVGLAVVAGSSLLVVAFLLGRTSASASRGAPSPPPLPRVVPPASTPAELPTAGAVPAAAPVISPVANPVPSRPPGADPLPVAPPPMLAATGSGPSAADPGPIAVRRYLDAVERIAPGEMGGGAESAANEMAAALANGDTGSLDALIRQAEEAKGRLLALSPPPPCAAHHRESAASLDDALEMLRALKSAMASDDPVARLAIVSARATALRERSEALKKEEAALRARYGAGR